MSRLNAVLLAGIFLIPSPVGGAEQLAVGGSTAERPLRFVLDTPLHVGGETRVRLRNSGDVAYNYNAAYEACDMVFRVRGGRKFLIPEGTHCDLIDPQRVQPGETVTLFRWDLDECVEDNWGCTKAKDLPRGRYVMKGWFRPAGGGDAERVVRFFRIRRG